MAAAATADSSVGAPAHHSAMWRPRKYLLSAMRAISRAVAGAAAPGVSAVMRKSLALRIWSGFDDGDKGVARDDGHLDPGEFVVDAAGVDAGQLLPVGLDRAHLLERLVVAAAREHQPDALWHDARVARRGARHRPPAAALGSPPPRLRPRPP